MSRLQQVLIGLLVVQVVLSVALFWPRPAPAGAGGAPLLGVKADDISAVTVRDDQGKSIKLVKSGPATGAGQAQWVLPDAGDYPVDASKITPLLTKLAEIKGNRLVGQTLAAQQQLKVADNAFSRRLDLETSSGTKTLYVGSSGGAGSSHVRLGGQVQVYLGSGIAAGDFATDPASWSNQAYFSVPLSEIAGITLKNANGQWTFEKGADGQWTMKELATGETVNQGSVQNLASAVSYVPMTRPLGKTEDPTYGLAQPAAAVTVVAKGADGEKSYELTVGAKNAADSSYVVKSSESPYYVRVDESSVKNLVEDRRDAFLQLPPTAMPGASAGTPAPTPAPQ